MDSNKSSSELARLMRAFDHSWHGLRYAAGEPAFRLELIAACVMMPLAFLITDVRVERALLIGSVFIVLIVELLNTAVERAVDRVSPEWHELSKIAKDVASAAVLLSLINAGAVWWLVVF